MPNYENGKIYEITGTDENGNKLTYIGSTTQFYLSTRLAHHIDNLKNDSSCSSKEVLKCKDYRINLIELYSCKCKEELRARERFYSDNNKCVNKLKPILFEGELQKRIKKYREEHKEQSKEYYEKNKDELLEYQKEYYEKNKEEMKEKHKKYHNNHKEQLNLKKREKYNKTKELKLMSNEDIKF